MNPSKLKISFFFFIQDDEFGVYEVDLKEFYERNGLTVYHVPFSSCDSYDKIMALIKDLESQGEKVVSHCTGGKGRCGRVACAWLCKKWSLSPLEASQEFIDQAVENGLYRLGDVQKLKEWIGKGSC
jgi:protein-tyrosine phosphatase